MPAPILRITKSVNHRQLRRIKTIFRRNEPLRLQCLRNRIDIVGTAYVGHGGIEETLRVQLGMGAADDGDAAGAQRLRTPGVGEH